MSQVFGDSKRLVNDYMAASHAIGIIGRFWRARGVVPIIFSDHGYPTATVQSPVEGLVVSPRTAALSVEVVALRGLQPGLREETGAGDHQPAVRRVDRGVRIGEADRSTAGQVDSPCPHLGDEQGELQAEAGQTDLPPQPVLGLTPDPSLT